VETEQYLREFVAPNPISCGRLMTPKSAGAITFNLAKLHITSANLAFPSVFAYLMQKRVTSKGVGSQSKNSK
jgi:hypothetical protein